MFGKKKKIIKQQREENLRMAEELQALKDQKAVEDEANRKRAEIDTLVKAEREKLQTLTDELEQREAKIKVKEKYGEMGETAEIASYIVRKTEGLTERQITKFFEVFFATADHKGIKLDYAKASHILTVLEGTSKEAAEKFAMVMGNKYREELDYEEPREIKRISNKKKKK